MIELDGTKNKSKLGANAILGVSLAVARTAALSINMPLYRYIGGISGNKMPVPLMNILNGGRHSDNNLNIQEFMIIPTGGSNFKECMQIGTEIYHVLKEILKKNNIMTSVGDEGGFSPNLSDDEEAIQLIVKAIEESGYKAGKDVSIGLDLASSEMREAAKKIEKEGYYFWKTKEYKTKDEMIEYIENLTKKFPITSIEDGLAEDDWKAWRDLTTKLGRNIQLVGDDLFVTNKERLKKGIQNKVANAILIKPNQIGTLTETLETIKLARASKYSTIISHRSGET
jgi:enolase